MFLWPITVIIASFAAVAATTFMPGHLESRENTQNGTVIMCSDFNWKGECIAVTVPLEYNSCISLKAPWYQSRTNLPSLPQILTSSHFLAPLSTTIFQTDSFSSRAYNVSSLEPVPGTVCWLHSSNNCSDICMSPQGCNKIVQFPGYANLSTYGYPGWTDRIGSFTCSPDGKTFFG